MKFEAIVRINVYTQEVPAAKFDKAACRASKTKKRIVASPGEIQISDWVLWVAEYENRGSKNPNLVRDP